MIRTRYLIPAGSHILIRLAPWAWWKVYETSKAMAFDDCIEMVADGLKFRRGVYEILCPHELVKESGNAN